MLANDASTAAAAAGTNGEQAYIVEENLSFMESRIVIVFTIGA